MCIRDRRRAGYQCPGISATGARTFRLHHATQRRTRRGARSLRDDHVGAGHTGCSTGTLFAMSFSSRARYWLPLLPLFGLLGATYWLNLQVQPQAAKPDSSKRHDPDAIIENFSATKLNEQGVPSFIMVAKKCCITLMTTVLRWKRRVSPCCLPN